MVYHPKAACAACKFQRRKCTAECSLAPRFSPEQPRRFSIVRKLFGVSNVLKLFNEMDASQREHVVKSIVYEAEARASDPVHGTYGTLQNLKRIEHDLQRERDDLRRTYEAMLVEEAKQGPHADQYVLSPSTSTLNSCSSASMGGIGPPRSSMGYSSHWESVPDLSAPRRSRRGASTQSQQYWMSAYTYHTGPGHVSTY